jgi:acetolactate synthase-1/2/3 large subunit
MSITKKQIYKVLAEDIKALGVDHVFVLMSDDTAALVSYLGTAGIQQHRLRHENQAIAAAEGYAAATGKLGVAIIGRGPATLNGANAAKYSQMTDSKVLIIYGDAPLYVSANTVGPDYKALDVLSLLSAMEVKTFKPSSPNSVRSTFFEAAREASLGNAVAYLLATDLQFMEVEDESPDKFLTQQQIPPQIIEKESIETIVALLEKSHKPLILAGIGAYNSGAANVLIKLAEKTGALLSTSLRARSMFLNNPLDIGIVGGLSHPCAKKYIEQSDCVIVFGASLNLWTTDQGTLFQHKKLIQIDNLQSNLGRWHPVDVTITGDARNVAEALLQSLPERSKEQKPFHTDKVLSELANYNMANDFQDSSTNDLMDARPFVLGLNQILPKNCNIISDAGCFMKCLPYLFVQSPDKFKLTANNHSIGLAFGPAIGFAVARPENLTTLFAGDGAFMMEIGELETVVREKLPMLIIVMNDSAYGMESDYLKKNQLPVEMTQFAEIDFASIAKGFGLEAYTVRSLEDLRKIAPAITNLEKPTLLDCKITRGMFEPFDRKP